MIFNITGNYTDFYQLKMAENLYLHNQHNKTAIFDYYFRKNPFEGGFAIFAGLQDLLECLENFYFSEDDIHFLKHSGIDSTFLNYLKKFKFKGTLLSFEEGDIIFPYEPVISVKASIIEAQLIETLLLNIINFQSLIATKARRLLHAANHLPLIDFGLRRAQGLGSFYASRAAIIGGVSATSHVAAAQKYNLKVHGTMSHAYVQSFESERAAFEQYVDTNPADAILLIDTYDTITSGLTNAISTAHNLVKKGYKLKGIRIDSGDIFELSMSCRKRLDDAGLTDVGIYVSNQLDEFVIEALMKKNAPINGFGVGTNLVTGYPDGALDGVYKMAMIDDRPSMKLSNSVAKMSWPYEKKILRAFDKNLRSYVEDSVMMAHESLTNGAYNYENPRLKVMELGKRLGENISPYKIKSFSDLQLLKFDKKIQCLTEPRTYQVNFSQTLDDNRMAFINEYLNNHV